MISANFREVAAEILPADKLPLVLETIGRRWRGARISMPMTHATTGRRPIPGAADAFSADLRAAVAEAGCDPQASEDILLMLQGSRVFV